MVDFMSHRRGLLASAGIVAATAATAFGASPALAATGANITGSGSSLQKVAQQSILDPGYAGGTLTNKPTVTYNSTSSGDGLAEFGDAAATINGHSFSAGTLNPGASNASGTGTALDAFIGTDDAPTASQISSAETASGGPKQITLPVLQAPVAILLSLPTTITLNASSKVNISNAELQAIWNPSGQTWQQVLTAAGLTRIISGTPTASQYLDSSSGSTAITRQARSGGSGTTFTFRGFLNESGDTNYPSSSVNDSDTWPSGVTVTETGNTGGGALVANTANSPGSTGYANLADAVAGGFKNLPSSSGSGSTAHQILYAQIQNNKGGSGAARYADPSANPASAATAAGNVYTGANVKVNGSPATGVGNWTAPTASDGSWAADAAGDVAPADDPDVYDHGSSAANYPIVAASFDEAWSSYTTGNLSGKYASGTANTVRDFFNYALGTSGQNALNADGYGKLPSAIASSANSHQIPGLPTIS